ncbi:L-rhamnose-binding lectin SML-like [Nothobranchius furzeri]|uniref:SUEL-type lectin domain-containing protein n=1 Tax=Nothobranchius furzeri TaxID=105023 RepID=A0A8C6KYX3_NOTFU|nr:L-rhamnose-binding lectin SML-like [Nothobranchius furzeri]
MTSRLLFLLLLGNMFCEAFGTNHFILCENSTIHPMCDAGWIIYVDSADYGRHDSTTCSFGRPPSELQNTSCSTLADVVAENCTGENSCSITASNDVFGDPCVGTFKYLDVTYECTFWFLP